MNQPLSLSVGFQRPQQIVGRPTLTLMRGLTKVLCLSLLMVVSCNRQQSLTGTQPSPTPSPTTTASPTPSPTLSLNEVFGWRKEYADLLGKPKEAAVERYGRDFKAEDQVVLKWGASERTGKRTVYLVVASPGQNANVTSVKVFARDGEQIEPLDILRKSSLLNFDTGTYRDSSTNYLVCTTKDKRNSVQFDVTDNQVTFRAVMFVNPKR